MAIATKWKKVISKTGVSQNTIADAVGINRGWFSKVCNGTAVLTPDELWRMNAYLSSEFGILVEDAYDPLVYDMLHGHKFSARNKRAKLPSVPVRISGENAADVDRLVDNGAYDSRNKAVNALLRRSLENESAT